MGKGIFWKMKVGELPLPKVAMTLGAKIVEVTERSGTIRMEYECKEDFTNPSGHIQGGILAAMLDDTMSLGLLSTLKEGEFAPTLEMKINFIAPVVIGRVSGYGKVVSKGRRVCVLEGELWQDAKLVAKSSATALLKVNKEQV